MKFEINNAQKLNFEQKRFDGSVHAYVTDSNNIIDKDCNYYISPGDMVMLFNYWIHIRKEKITDGFIKPW